MKNTLPKVSFAAALCLGAVSAVVADSDTFAFYSFKDGAAGTSAVGLTLANQVDASANAGSATCPEANATATAKFEADAPGAFIYESALESAELLCAAPQSIHLSSESGSNAGTLTFANTGTEFSKCGETGFTLEFFIRMAADETWSAYNNTVAIPAYQKISDGTLRTYYLYLPCDNATRLRYGMGGYDKSKYEAAGNPITIAALNDDKWHHVAFVQHPDGTIEIFLDYVRKVSVSLTISQVAELDGNYAVKLALDRLRGKYSCVRMTRRALGRNEFMRAANRAHAPTVTADPDVLAFYPFDDGEAGSSAAGAVVSSVANPQLSKGTVTVSDEATASATFDADAPGKYVFVGEHYADTPIYTNPASIFVTSDVTGSSGSIKLAGLGTRLSRHHDRGHTVEYFVKMLDSRFTGFVSHFSCAAGYGDSATHSAALNLYMPFAMGSSYANGRQFRVAVGSYSGSYVASSSTQYDLWDGYWHHVALVETNSVVAASGELPETTNYFVTVYVDYVARVSLKTAGAFTLDASDANVLLGNNADHAKYSCLRATARALKRSEFLRASNCETYWPKTVFHWTLDGKEESAFPTVLTNAVVSFHELNSNVYSSAQAALTGNGGVTIPSLASYSSRTKSAGAPVCDGEGDKNPRANGGCAYISSGSTGEDGFRTSAYLGISTSAASSAYAAGRGFSVGDFTAEGFFKFDKTAWLDGIGTYAAEKPRLTLMTRTRTANTGSKSAWVVTLQGASSSNAYLQLGSYSEGGEGSTANSARGVMVDKRWHHVAVTYDSAAGRLVGYLDYKPFATNELSAALSYTAQSSFFVGLGTSVNNNGFHGWVDEVRYSRECLDPSEFLRIDAVPGTTIIVY